MVINHLLTGMVLQVPTILEISKEDTLPETKPASLPLKIDGWKTILSFWVSAYFQGLCWFQGEYALSFCWFRIGFGKAQELV